MWPQPCGAPFSFSHFRSIISLGRSAWSIQYRRRPGGERSQCSTSRLGRCRSAPVANHRADGSWLSKFHKTTVLSPTLRWRLVSRDASVLGPTYAGVVMIIAGSSIAAAYPFFYNGLYYPFSGSIWPVRLSSSFYSHVPLRFGQASAKVQLEQLFERANLFWGKKHLLLTVFQRVKRPVAIAAIVVADIDYWLGFFSRIRWTVRSFYLKATTCRRGLLTGLDLYEKMKQNNYPCI